ncbi:hypothetical protein [Companilactobacillus metriopterae]|uniref:hypothetical protein n=1 Tax=Companilactobacillus metriopterae TaxID=1909267 RepID=UPI00100B2145|nr:hypothetical protein [Companilactobacillus metriopterae]
MKKFLISTIAAATLLTVTATPAVALADTTDDGVSVESSQETVDIPVVLSIPADATNITAITFTRGTFSPDIYISSRALKLIVGSGAVASSAVVSLIPTVGPVLATSIISNAKEYAGFVDEGIVIHVNKGLVSYVSGQ